MLGRNVVLVLKLARATVTENVGRQVIPSFLFCMYVGFDIVVFLEHYSIPETQWDIVKRGQFCAIYLDEREFCL